MDYILGKEKSDGSHEPGIIDDPNNYAGQLLKGWISANPKKWNIVKRCLGIAKSRGVHAGGVLIMPSPVASVMPVMKATKGWASALNMKYVEKVGGIKYDFLGVKCLKALGICLRAIEEHTGKVIPWEEPPHDPKVYEEVYHKGNLAGIFQVDTDTMKPFVVKMKPRNVKEISNIIALVRPGALDAPSPRPGDPETRKAADYYADCAIGNEKSYYMHPDLEPILDFSFGVILFQEQTLKIFNQLGGLTLAEADIARRGMGKKDAASLEKALKPLIDNLRKKGTWTEDQIKRLTDTITASNRYSFNEAHSCLPLSAKVHTEEGSKTIEQIVTGEFEGKVGFISENGCLEYEKPSAVLDQGVKEVFEVVFEDNTTLQLTADHRVWHNNSWVEFGELIKQGVDFESVDFSKGVKEGFVPVRG